MQPDGQGDHRMKPKENKARLSEHQQPSPNMKRNQLAPLLVLVSLILSLSIGLQQSTSAAERLLPRISFEKTVCDLGDVDQGTKNSCEFSFTNTGGGLLKIGNISRTCGCTVFQLDKKQYAPNETGVIKVIYTAGKSTSPGISVFYWSKSICVGRSRSPTFLK